MTGFENVIKQAGGQAALAELLGVTQQAVSFWKSNGLPIHRAIEIEEKLEGVTRQHVLPDIFGEPPVEEEEKEDEVLLLEDKDKLEPDTHESVEAA